MFQQTQNEEYLHTITHRVRHEYLTWCEQFLDILEQQVRPPKGALVQDIGCNAGQFYKSLKRRGLPLDYMGYDIEPAYLEIARREFPELEKRVALLDIESSPLPQGDVAVMSATLEHLEDPAAALGKMLASSRVAALVRTFLGEKSLKQSRLKPGALRPYVIRQFRIEDLMPTIERQGFRCEVVEDRFTGSKPTEVSDGIVRSQYIFLLRRA